MRVPGKRKRLNLVARIKNGFFPVLMGSGLFLTYPSLVAHQDVASFLGTTGQIGTSERWLASLIQPAGLSTLATGSISKASKELPSREESRFVGKKSEADGAFSAPLHPSYKISNRVRTERMMQTVNRSLKGGRVISATVVRPPEKFNAGRVIERHSLLRSLSGQKIAKPTFTKAKPAKEVQQIVAAFHPKPKKPVPPKPKANLPVVVASLVKETTPNILAYAPEPKVKSSPFEEVLKIPQPVKLRPKLNKEDHAWAAKPLPMSSFSKREQRCLAEGIYFEARGEPTKGQAAVAQVILNRVRNPSYPDTICGVVYQNKHMYNRCQFSFACDRIKDKVHNRKLWRVATHVAREMTEGRIWLKEVGSSTHYHATYVSPKWARKMKRVGKIGLHIFYRTHKGGWS